jgi:hypothetical protein
MRADPADDLAAELTRRGLAVPAAILVDAHRPIAPLLRDVAVAIRPLLGVGGRLARAGLTLLGERDGLERLERRLTAGQTQVESECRES